jgi:hypothetical protein
LATALIASIALKVVSADALGNAAFLLAGLIDMDISSPSWRTPAMGPRNGVNGMRHLPRTARPARFIPQK